MRKIITVLLCSVMALEGYSASSMFLRVFDIHNTKIAKGRLIGTTDSSLILSNGNSSFEIPCTEIGSIKTGRSIGHDILINALVTTCAVSVILFIVSDVTFQFVHDLSLGIYGKKSPKGSALFTGLLSGVATGILTGLTSGRIKHSTPLMVNGNREDWSKVKSALEIN